MRSAKTLLLLLGFLTIGILPASGQTPASALDFHNRGKEKYASGDRAGALADFNKAIELDPRYAMAYNNRGVVLNDADMKATGSYYQDYKSYYYKDTGDRNSKGAGAG